jgi:hypothetical protein
MKKFTQYLDTRGLQEALSHKEATEVSLVEAKLSRVFQYVEDDKKDFGIVSAFRGTNSDKENKARHEELKKMVRQMGYGFIELRGGYKGDEGYVEELSLLIPNITKKGIVDLGRNFQQHSVMYKNDQDFYYIGTNEEAGVGKVLMRFKKGAGQDNLELAKHKVIDFFSSLKKGPHSDTKFVFNVKDETPQQKAQGKEATSGRHPVACGAEWMTKATTSILMTNSLLVGSQRNTARDIASKSAKSGISQRLRTCVEAKTPSGSQSTRIPPKTTTK